MFKSLVSAVGLANTEFEEELSVLTTMHVGSKPVSPSSPCWDDTEHVTEPLAREIDSDAEFETGRQSANLGEGDLVDVDPFLEGPTADEPSGSVPSECVSS